MTTRQRTITAVIGLLTSFIMAGTTLVPAQAKAAANQPAPDHHTANQLSASRHGPEHITPFGSGSTTTRDGNHNGSVIPRDGQHNGGIIAGDGHYEGNVTQGPGRTVTPSVTAPPPSTYPAVSPRFSSSFFPPCGSGYVCAAVPYAGQYYVFDFYYYGTYGLSNWFGGGGIQNFQTGNAAARLLDRNGREVRCLRPGWTTTLDWGPIWYIRLTPGNCS